MKFKATALCVLLLSLIAGVARAVIPDQPNMVAARADLNIAKRELMVAEHNKGGHRAKAIEYINSAIVQINKGIAYDRRNNHASAITENQIFAFSSVPDQPHMRAALESLRNAKAKLERATSDKGGHRVKALEFIDQAIDEVNKGIAVVA